MFDADLSARGYHAISGQIVDPSIVHASMRQSSAEAKDAIKAGGTPKDWSAARAHHKDRDARWAKKYSHSFFGD